MSREETGWSKEAKLRNGSITLSELFFLPLPGWRNTNCRNNEVSSLGKNLMVQEASEMKQISHSVLRLVFLQGGF